MPFKDREQEKDFRAWYARNLAPGINPNPDDPRHHYDYRAAFLAGATPDPKTHHWPSEFKTEGHPRTYMSQDGSRFSATQEPGFVDTRAMPQEQKRREFSDDELLRLAEGGITQEEADALGPDDLQRLGRLHATRNQKEPLTSGSAPQRPAPGMLDPLEGKPTIGEFEAGKALAEQKQRIAEQPKLTKPTRTIPGPPVEEPFSIKGLIDTMGQALAGNRPIEEDQENFKTPSWDKSVRTAAGEEEEITNPGERYRAAQERLLESGQLPNMLAGPQPDTPQHNEVAARIAQAALQEGLVSATQFVSHPMQQAAERPLEFGLNLLPAALELGQATRAIRAAGTLTKAEKAAATAKAVATAGRDWRFETQLRESLGDSPDVAGALKLFAKNSGRVVRAAKDPLDAVRAITDGFEQVRIGEADRVTFAKEFNTRLEQAHEALDANRGKMTPAQYREAQAKIDDMVRKRLLTETSDTVKEGVDAARGSAADDAVEAATNPEAEAELERKMSEARLKRPALPRFGEEEAPARRASDQAARARIESATPEEVAATHMQLETKLDEVASLKEANRALGGDPIVSAKLRAIEEQVEGAQQAIADVRSAVGAEPEPFGTGDVVRHPASGKTYTVESVEIRPGGKAIVNVQDANGVRSRFAQDALEVTDEAPHVPPGVTVPKTLEEWAAFHGGIPEAAASPEELARLAENTAIPGAEVVVPPKPPPAKGTKITTADGITYEFQSEMKGAKGKPPIRYWKADQPMPDGGGKAGSQVSEDVIRRNGLVVPEETPAAVPEAPSVTTPENPAEVSSATEVAQGALKLTDVLSTAPLGGILLAGLAQDNKDDPTPSQGSPLALKSALWAIPAGLFTFGVARAFAQPEFRAALSQFLSIDKAQPADLERVFETAIAPWLPDTPANGQGKVSALVGAGAGATIGGLVGARAGRDEASVPGGAIGALLGIPMGVHAAGVLARNFQSARSMRDLYRMYVTEAAGMSPSALNMKQITRFALEGRIRQIKDLAEELNSFNPSTQGAIQAWMAGNANLLTVPEKARPAAQAARKLFDDLSMDLLKSGLVKDKVLRDTIRTNIGTYLPRLFLRYELDDPREIVQSWLQGQGKNWGYISSKDYLKARKQIPPDVLKALGEITENPGYLLARRGTVTAADIEMARYHRFLLSSPENSIPTSIARSQKRVNTIQKQLIAGGGSVTQPPMVRFYRAKGGMEAAEWQGRTYWKMPDDPRYGLVRGKFIEQAVASDIRSTYETTGGLQKLFDAPVSIFKFWKAVYNPASQFRNMAANTILADVVGGIAPWRMDKWGQGLVDLNRRGKWYQQAVKDGVFGGEYTVAEIGNLLIPEIHGASSMMEVTADHVIKLSNATNQALVKWHAGSEAWARMTVYRHAIEEIGLSGSEAARYARRVIPDYQDVPRWIKVVRKSPFGAPFVSFSYKAIPRIMEAAFAFGDPKKMMRFWKYPTAMAALNEYSAQKNGLLGKGQEKDIFGTLKRTMLRTLSAGNYSPDAYDTYRKYLPHHVGKMQIALPWRDQYDRQQYLDGTYFLPWGDAGEMGTGEMSKGLGLSWFPRQLEPSNPWLQMAIAASTGKDSFTGRDIVPAGAVGIEADAARAQFFMRAWGPSLLNPAGYGAESLGRAASGDFTEDPNTKDLPTAIKAEVFGARIRPVDPRSSYRFRVMEMQKELDANMQEIRRAIPELAQREDITNQEAMAYAKAHPESKGARAIRRRFELRNKFLDKYGRFQDQPPSPEKLVEAMKKAHKRPAP